MNFIAQNALTMSKKQYPHGTPYSEDADFVDYCCGLGAQLLEDNGNCPSLPSRAEQSLAFKLTDIFPFVERVKLLKTGSDACSAAVRIARAYTGKDYGIGTGYHGWHNSFINEEDPGTGCVREYYHKCPKLEGVIGALKKLDHYAYCIIEPVELDLNVKDELKEIRRLCSEKGIVLIFDEVLTGFRFPEYSVSNFYNIQPDIICLGKGLGNGHSISVVGGRSDIMETEGYFVSGTFFGELSGIESALATLNWLTADKIMDLWKRGEDFIKRFNDIADIIQLEGYPTRCIWKGEPLFIATFCQQMQKRGYLLHPRVWFIRHDHDNLTNSKFISQAKACIEEIVEKNIQLKGPMAEPVFKR